MAPAERASHQRSQSVYKAPNRIAVSVAVQTRQGTPSRLSAHPVPAEQRLHCPDNSHIGDLTDGKQGEAVQQHDLEEHKTGGSPAPAEHSTGMPRRRQAASRATLVSMLSIASSTKSGRPPKSCSSASAVYMAFKASTRPSGRIFMKWSCITSAPISLQRLLRQGLVLRQFQPVL